jgi:endogenous inhibitor of DNA gyrase (YacG/DUF329 family)
MDGSLPLSPAAKPCPICAKPVEPVFRPFCSKRCADVDLNRWLVGTYAIPTNESEEDEAAPPMRDPESE